MSKCMMQQRCSKVNAESTRCLNVLLGFLSWHFLVKINGLILAKQAKTVQAKSGDSLC